MDKVLESISFSFLLRCLFAGVFFSISFLCADIGPDSLKKLIYPSRQTTKQPASADVKNDDKETTGKPASANTEEDEKESGGDMLSTWMAVSLFAGVTIYGIHRSLLYPAIEWGFNAWGPKNACISDKTLVHLETLWKMGARKEGIDESVAIPGKKNSMPYHARHIAVWADYTHQQYTAAWCILAGAILGKQGHETDANCWLIGICVLLFIAALVSDVRLRSVVRKVYNPGE